MSEAAASRAVSAVATCRICGGSAQLLGRQDYPMGNAVVETGIYRCGACDFHFRVFLDHVAPLSEHFVHAFYSRAEIEPRWSERRQGFYDWLLRLLGPADSRSLLDIGCGFGHFLERAARRGYRVYGTEISESMAARVRERLGFPVSSRPLRELQLAERQFDVVTFVDSFYYFEDPVSALRDVAWLLKPDGRLLLRVTNRNFLARMCSLGNRVLGSPGGGGLPFHATDDAISCHSRRSLEVVLERAGFRIERLQSAERGKRLTRPLMRAYNLASRTIATLTFGHVNVSSGLVCIARPG